MDKLGTAARNLTAGDVEHRLVAAFRTLPLHPVLSKGARLHARTAAGQPHAEALNWVGDFVTNDFEKKTLLAWASCLATGVTSVRDRYLQMNWPRATAERARRRGVQRIVAGLKKQQLGLDSETNRFGALMEREAADALASS